jgi:hypothetical protein
MRHASAERLEEVRELLEKVRELGKLRERKMGVFYWNGKAFLHFHEDEAGMFADVWTGRAWKRVAVNRAGQVKLLLTEIRNAMKGGS